MLRVGDYQDDVESVTPLVGNIETYSDDMRDVEVRFQ